LAVFLPVLLFESSFSMDVHQIKVFTFLIELLPWLCWFLVLIVLHHW
jgi:hypothetical protein